MQVCDAEVQIGGDHTNNTVCVTDITPPEILVLRALHGQDRVFNILPRKQDKRPHEEEFARLIEKYGRRFQREGETDVVRSLFPGIRPNLPVSLSDINITEDQFHRDYVPPKTQVSKEPEPV